MIGVFLRAFAYPLSKNNLWVMAVGVTAFCLPQVVAWVLPATGMLVWVIQFLLVLYFALFFQGILETSMAGKSDFPAWPEQPNLLAYAESIFGILGPYVVSFLPLIVLRCAYADFGELGRKGFGLILIFLSGPIPQVVPKAPAWFEPVSWALAAAGLAYLPMALLIWSFFGGNAVLNPVMVIRNCLRAAGSYALLIGLVAALLLGWMLAVRMLVELPFEWARSLLTLFSLFYVACVIMRMIGLHYFANRERLQWERTT